MHLRLCVGPSVDAWLSTHPIIIFFYLTLEVFSIALRTNLGLSHLLVLEESHCIYNQPLDLMGIHLLHCTHVGARMVLHDIVRMFSQPLQKMQHFTFHKIKPMSFHPCLAIFTLSNWHCAINWWCLRVGKCCHCWLHSSWFGFVDYSFSWGCATIAT